MPSADLLLMAALLVVQQVLHHREKRDLMDRLGKPTLPKGPTVHQTTMKEKMERIQRGGEPL